MANLTNLCFNSDCSTIPDGQMTKEEILAVLGLEEVEYSMTDCNGAKVRYTILAQKMAQIIAEAENCTATVCGAAGELFAEATVSPSMPFTTETTLNYSATNVVCDGRSREIEGGGTVYWMGDYWLNTVEIAEEHPYFMVQYYTDDGTQTGNVNRVMVLFSSDAEISECITCSADTFTIELGG